MVKLSNFLKQKDRSYHYNSLQFYKSVEISHKIRLYIKFMKEQITFNDYKKIEIRIGTVLSVSQNKKARKPSLVLKVDFGKEIGIKQSSAQITHYYSEGNLVGKQVIGVCNFPQKNHAS